MTTSTELKPMPLWLSLLLFGVPTVILYAATRLLIPFLDAKLNLHPALLWFLVGGLVVFIPLFVAALLAAQRDVSEPGLRQLFYRLRLKKMSLGDWLWSILATVAILLLTGIVMTVANAILAHLHMPPLQTSPPFLHFDPLVDRQRWILLAWLPFFFFNIMGEELMWRGYILPRQQLAHGSLAWVVNSLLWIVFHICFGWALLLTLLPILLILPLVVYKRGNTWIGVVIHALVNGPAFIVLSLGVLG